MARKRGCFADRVVLRGRVVGLSLSWWKTPRASWGKKRPKGGGSERERAAALVATTRPHRAHVAAHRTTVIDLGPPFEERPERSIPAERIGELASRYTGDAGTTDLLLL